MAAITPEKSATRQRSGQQNNAPDGFIIPFLEFEQPYRDNGSGVMVTGFEGMEGYEIDPISDTAARIRVTDADAVAVTLEGIESACPITIPRIDFPPVLKSIVTTYTTSVGAGADSHPAANITIVFAGDVGASVHPKSRSQGSAAVMPAVQPEFEERWAQNVPAMEYTFYLVAGSDMADVLAKLTTMAGATVEAWPQFRPKPHTVVLTGQQADVSANADTRHFGSGTSSEGSKGKEYGSGTSVSRGATVRTERWPAAIHGALDLGDTIMSADAEADAEANVPELDFGDIGIVTATTNAASASEEVEATVEIDSTTATENFTDIPATGLRMYQLQPGPEFYGVNSYRALVVNFADL